MAEIPRPQLHKIPGNVMPLAKEVHTKDLSKLTRVELLEIKDREEKLLADKARLKKLPDRGKRIQDYYDRVLAELERRANVNEAAVMFSALNIATQGERVLNEMEWNGRLNGNHLDNHDPTEDVLDSDDEAELDPLRIIAQRSMHKRQVKLLPPETSLITAQDLAEINSFQSDSPDSGLSSESKDDIHNNVVQAAINAELVEIDVTEKLLNIKPKLQHIIDKSTSKPNSVASDSHSVSPSLPDVEQHVRYLVEKTEQHVPTQREKFKPYKTTVSNVHDPEKERNRKKNKYWEVTAATPPHIQHSGTKLLTLLDSVEIQANYLAKLKKLQDLQATERLAARAKRLEQRQVQLPDASVLKTNPAFTTYRVSTNHIEGDQRFNEDDEVHDPLEEEKPGGGVTYTVFND